LKGKVMESSEMTTYKSIALDQIDVKQGNLGELDEGRYDLESEGMKELAGQIMAAGTVVSPITVAQMDGGYKLILGKRRYTASRYWAESGHDRFAKIDCRVLTKDQAADQDYLLKLMILDDTTQQRISAFAEATGIFNRFENLKDTLRAEDGSMLKEKEVKDYMIAEQGVDTSNQKGAAYLAAKEKLNVCLRVFSAVPGSWLDACKKGILSPNVAVKAVPALDKANMELKELGYGEITPEIILDQFPEGFSMDRLNILLAGQIKEASLQKNRDKILAGMPDAVAQAEANSEIGLEAVSTLKKEGKASDFDLEDIFTRAKELSAVEGEGQKTKVQPQHVSAAITALEQETPSQEVTYDEIYKTVKLFKKILGFQLDETYSALELQKLLTTINGASVKIARLFDKHETMLAQQAEADAQSEAETPDAA
jgi:ParB-like nuclease domain